jgi:hypothetical protein
MKYEIYFVQLSVMLLPLVVGVFSMPAESYKQTSPSDGVSFFKN